MITHASSQRFIEHPPAPQLDEQWHEELAAGQIQIDDQRIVDLLDHGERAVDLSSADANAMPVERGIRPAEHVRTPALIEADEVSVPPDARIQVEVTLAVALAVRI